MKQLLPEDAVFLSLDDPDMARVAGDSAQGFLMRHRNQPCVAIDAVQKIPELLQAVEDAAGQAPDQRRFLLASSVDCKALPASQAAMASGRLGRVRLRPLTEGEMQGNPPRLIDRLLQGDLDGDVSYDECNKALILQKAMLGGFPELLSCGERQRGYWLDAYLDGPVKKDFEKLTQSRKPGVFQKLLKLSAASSCQPLNISRASASLALSRATLNKYLSALQAMFLVEEVPAWRPEAAGRTASTPRLMLCDSGLMSHLTGLGAGDAGDARRLADDGARSDLVESLIKTWVCQQLIPLTDLGKDWSLRHFRSRIGKKIDFILEHRNGDMLCLDVKTSEGIKPDYFKDLRWFREQFGQNRRMKTVVLYCGWITQQYSEDEYALPMAWLWK